MPNLICSQCRSDMGIEACEDNTPGVCWSCQTRQCREETEHTMPGSVPRLRNMLRYGLFSSGTIYAWADSLDAITLDTEGPLVWDGPGLPGGGWVLLGTTRSVHGILRNWWLQWRSGHPGEEPSPEQYQALLYEVIRLAKEE